MSDPVFSLNRYYPAGTSGGYYDLANQQCVLEKETPAPQPVSNPVQEAIKPSVWNAKKILALFFYTGRSQGTSRCGYIAEKGLNKAKVEDGSVDAPKDAGVDAADSIRDIWEQEIPTPDASPDAPPDAPLPDVSQDSPKPDTAPDGPQPDIAPDTVPPDTIPPDTIPPDTLKPDTVPPVCTVGTLTPLTETDFKVVASVSTLTNLDYYSLLGSLMLKRNWTGEWVADDGILPSWTLFPSNAVSLGMVSWANDTSSGGAKVLNMDSLSCSGCPTKPDAGPLPGADQKLYYEISPTFTSAGGVVQVTWRLVTENPTGPFFGCEASVEIANGSNAYRPGLLAGSPGSIEDVLSTGVSIAQDTKSKLFTLRTEFKSNTVRYFINEQGPQAKTNSYSTGNNYIRFSDNCGTHDGQIYIRAIAYYNVSDHVPFSPTTGNFTRIFDFGSAVNSFKTLTFNGSTPSLTSLQFTTRSGNTAVPNITWSSEQAATGTGKTLTIQSPAARYIQVKVTLNTSDNLVSPTVDDFTVNACK
jgi:hypothetical protein